MISELWLLMLCLKLSLVTKYLSSILNNYKKVAPIFPKGGGDGYGILIRVEIETFDCFIHF